MRLADWLTKVTEAFSMADIESARLDALILLEDALHRDRAWLLAHSDEIITPEALDTLADDVERRLQHEPLAYIRGHTEFYGRRFMVDENVLIPRPESEAMIELFKKVATPGVRVADIGTGSGCLAITAALESDAVVCAVDIDEACLAVATQNAVSLTASVTTLQGSLLQPFLRSETNFTPEILLANLPYVPDTYEINDAARHEPALALFAGSDGLNLYRQLFDQTKRFTRRPRFIITEALHEQHEPLVALAADADYQLGESDGLAQLFADVG